MHVTRTDDFLITNDQSNYKGLYLKTYFMEKNDLHFY